MKMKITLFGSFGLLLFLLSSCSNLIEKTDLSENTNSAILKICLNDNCRTVFPNTILNELTNFELHGLISNEDYSKNLEYDSNGYSYENYEKTLGTYSSLSDLQKAEIKLDTGEWSFTLTAKKGGTTYKAVKTQTIIEGENTLSFDLELYNSGKGKGAFAITLDFSEADNSDKVTSAKAVLQNMDGTEVNGFALQTLTVTDNKVTYSENQLPVGSYRVMITLYSGTLELLTWREIVIISSDLVSSAERKIDSIDSIYKITYVLNDDESRKAIFSSDAQEMYTRRTYSFNIPTISRPSYKFLGWYESEEFSGEPITEIDTSRLENITLYAKWQNLFSDSTLQSLSFSGNDVKIFNNETQRNEISANVNIHEYYVEYKTLTVNAELSNPRASVSLSNSNDEMKIEAIDSTKQDIVLTATSEDDTSSTTYLIHAVKIFNYEEACSLIETRTQSLFVKIIDEKDNINTKGSKISDTSTIPSVIGKAINMQNYAVALDLSSTNIDSIGNYAFYYCTQLESIIFPNTITSINEAAFLQCNNLVEMILPNSLCVIGNNAFHSCSKLKEIIIPEGVNRINGGVFANCEALEKIVIPSTVNYIVKSAFNNLSSLHQLIFSDTTAVWYGSILENMTIKYQVGCMSSPEENINAFRNYQYYKVF